MKSDKELEKAVNKIINLVKGKKVEFTNKYDIDCFRNDLNNLVKEGRELQKEEDNQIGLKLLKLEKGIDKLIMDNQIMGIENAKLRQQLAEQKAILNEDGELQSHQDCYFDGFDKGREQATSDILEMIDEMFPKCICSNQDDLNPKCPNEWVECWSDGLNKELKQKIQGVKGE